MGSLVARNQLQKAEGVPASGCVRLTVETKTQSRAVVRKRVQCLGEHRLGVRGRRKGRGRPRPREGEPRAGWVSRLEPWN